MTALYLDADACPVRDEVYRVVERTGIGLLVVHNGSRPIRVPGLPAVRLVIVDGRMDAADDWIAERIDPGDLCVTADIPLAARCLERGARALAHNGHVWTRDNIGAALAGRDLSRHLRELGQAGGGPAFGRNDRSRFLVALDTVITLARKDGPGTAVP
jgi:uncharacterized protein YaiI (UPF0178 family)